jgi:hypothetical protein
MVRILPRFKTESEGVSADAQADNVFASALPLAALQI